MYANYFMKFCHTCTPHPEARASGSTRNGFAGPSVSDDKFEPEGATMSGRTVHMKSSAGGNLRRRDTLLPVKH